MKKLLILFYIFPLMLLAQQEVPEKYWLDDSNYVWKSVQNISPKIPPISFTVTKKPR